MTEYLSVQQLLFLHMRLIETTGGTHGVRDLGLLQAAVARPQATFDGQELYPDLFSKAAALMHSLILSHPMIDGNKRLGIAAAGIFLERNGVRLNADNAALEAFTLGVAQGGVDAEDISQWLAANSVQHARSNRP
jgi:death on curing protein